MGSLKDDKSRRSWLSGSRTAGKGTHALQRFPEFQVRHSRLNCKSLKPEIEIKAIHPETIEPNLLGVAHAADRPPRRSSSLPASQKSGCCRGHGNPGTSCIEKECDVEEVFHFEHGARNDPPALSIQAQSCWYLEFLHGAGKRLQTPSKPRQTIANPTAQHVRMFAKAMCSFSNRAEQKNV